MISLSLSTWLGFQYQARLICSVQSSNIVACRKLVAKTRNIFGNSKKQYTTHGHYMCCHHSVIELSSSCSLFPFIISTWRHCDSFCMLVLSHSIHNCIEMKGLFSVIFDVSNITWTLKSNTQGLCLVFTGKKRASNILKNISYIICLLSTQ